MDTRKKRRFPWVKRVVTFLLVLFLMSTWNIGKLIKKIAKEPSVPNNFGENQALAATVDTCSVGCTTATCTANTCTGSQTVDVPNQDTCHVTDTCHVGDTCAQTVPINSCSGCSQSTCGQIVGGIPFDTCSADTCSACTYWTSVPTCTTGTNCSAGAECSTSCSTQVPYDTCSVTCNTETCTSSACTIETPEIDEIIIS